MNITNSERFVIFVEIVDCDLIECILSAADSKSFKEQVLRPVLTKLERICEVTNGFLSNTGINPFILEVTGVQNLIEAADALAGCRPEYRLNVPQSLASAGYASIDFYIGIALADLGGRDNYQGVTQAQKLAIGSGRNHIHVDSNVAAILSTAGLEAMELLLRGQHRFNEDESPSFIFELLHNPSNANNGSQKQEIVKLTLAVIDLLGSTMLKAMMGKSHQECLETYEKEILDPFREVVKRLCADFSGTVIDSVGDSFFVSFDEEDDARRWAVACLAQNNRIKAPEDYGFPVLKYHFSIDAGKVLRDVRGNLQGAHVDRVHRLNDLSHEDQIILSPPVGALLMEALTDPVTEGVVVRHSAKYLQGIVGETDIYEYCPPGTEPRSPRESKGGVNFINYSLAAVSNDAIFPSDPAITRGLMKRYGGRTAMATAQLGRAQIFAFESVLDSARFLIDCRKYSPRADRHDFRGTIHYGLLMEKEGGRLEGADLLNTQRLFHECPEDTILISNAAIAQIHHTNNRWFKLQEVSSPPSCAGKSGGHVYRINPKLPVFAQVSLAITALILFTVVGWWAYASKIVDPLREKQAAFVSLVPSISGSSWFEEMPWYTPRMRLLFYERRSDLDHWELTRLKSLVLGENPEKFISGLQELIPESFFNECPEAAALRLGSGSAQEALHALLSRRFMRNCEPEAVDWHLLGILLGSIPIEKDPFADIVYGDLLPAIAKLANQPAGLQRAVTAYDQAISLYKPLKGTNRSAVNSGLSALCYSDLAETYMKSSDYTNSSKNFTIARHELSFSDAPLLNARVLTLHGECQVHTLFGTSGKIDSDYPDFDANAEFFVPALKSLDSCGAARNHPLRAGIKQRQAHYFLETWQLRETEKSATEATDIQRHSPFVTHMIDDLSKDNPGYRSATGQSACMEYVRCQLLCALSAHFSGNNDDAQTALAQSITYINAAIETSDDSMKDLWRDQLANFHQRYADHHLYAFGDVHDALEQFKACVQVGKEAGHDEPNHPLHHYYLAQMASVAWMSVICGDLAAHQEALSSLHDGADPVSMNEPYWLTYSLANVFAAPSSVGPDLLKLLKTAGNHFLLSSPTRDERQLLLFICEYLRLEHEDGGMQYADRDAVDNYYDVFSSPWSDSKEELGSSSYLKGLARSAQKVRHNMAIKSLKRVEAELSVGAGAQLSSPNSTN